MERDCLNANVKNELQEEKESSGIVFSENRVGLNFFWWKAEHYGVYCNKQSACSHLRLRVC